MGIRRLARILVAWSFILQWSSLHASVLTISERYAARVRALNAKPMMMTSGSFRGTQWKSMGKLPILTPYGVSPEGFNRMLHSMNSSSLMRNSDGFAVYGSRTQWFGGHLPTNASDLDVRLFPRKSIPDMDFAVDMTSSGLGIGPNFTRRMEPLSRRMGVHVGLDMPTNVSLTDLINNPSARTFRNSNFADFVSEVEVRDALFDKLLATGLDRDFAKADYLKAMSVGAKPIGVSDVFIGRQSIIGVRPSANAASHINALKEMDFPFIILMGQ